MLVYEKGGLRVHEVEGEFVAADAAGWLDGVWVSLDECVDWYFSEPRLREPDVSTEH